jgi:hypothetical protein
MKSWDGVEALNKVRHIVACTTTRIHRRIHPFRNVIKRGEQERKELQHIRDEYDHSQKKHQDHLVVHGRRLDTFISSSIYA